MQWLAGNFACKVFLFLRAFGLYLSSNVLVCVSLDRYFAVLHPLRVNDARRRGKIMLAFAWGMSLLCAIPQVRIIRTSPRVLNCRYFDDIFLDMLREMGECLVSLCRYVRKTREKREKDMFKYH